jgi:SAM-dependent methyltransferase
MLKDYQDAFGHEIHDFHYKKTGHEIVERDDGYISVSFGPEIYFKEFADWLPSEREAMSHVSGRVMDIGCGAGRAALYLQDKGFSVTGIDNSPLAIEVCLARGVRDARLLPLTRISRKLGTFDTILMLGNNFALLANPVRARWFLKRLHSMTSASGTIIAQTRDPYQTDEPEFLSYHKHNRKRGKMSGEIRFRVRYKKYATPWLAFLMVSQDEMKSVIEGSGWRVERFIDDLYGIYIAVLKKVADQV